MGNNGLPEASTAILDKAWKDAEILSRKTSLEMDYGLYRGVSVLRSFSDDQQTLFDPSHYGFQDTSTLDDEKLSSLYRAAAIMLLLEGSLGAAHEVLLGVTPKDIETAEYAASHPGQTSWAKDHPSSFTDVSDWIHSVLHRLEGNNVGEGDHTGFHNARYWALGGPKSLHEPAEHPLREVLAMRGPFLAPLCVAKGLLKQNSDSVKIWDDLAFIDLCRLRHEGKLTEEECAEVVKLQQLEICALLHNELCLAHGLDPAIERTKD